jgi:hypothetical protein
LSTKWLKHQGSVQKQEGTLKPTIAYYETVSVSFSPKKHTITFEHKQTQYTANPRGSERQRVNLGLSDPQTIQAKHTCCRCRAKPPLLQRRRFSFQQVLPPMKAVMFSKVLKSLSLLLCGAKPKLAFSA